MGHDDLRHDTECQNCGHTVAESYCPHCGQKNTETRQSFGHLLTHFAEDLTHYDNAFWKTIKYLLFRPAKLTKDYLIGKRHSYVLPVKLYLFISFIAFLLIGLLSGGETAHEKNKIPHGKNNETVRHDVNYGFGTDTIRRSKVLFKSVRELEAFQSKAPEGKKLGTFSYWYLKKLAQINEKDIEGAVVAEAIIHTLPKVLFIYMPIFAFWLWLFHGKKRWYFFDHGIFTLHYFSFLLLLIIIISLTDWLLSIIFSLQSGNAVSILTANILLCYAVFYFFRAHSKMYGERPWISRLKSVFMLLINSICVIAVLVLTVFYILITIH